MTGAIIALIIAVIVVVGGYLAYRGYLQQQAAARANLPRNQIGAGAGALVSGILGEVGL